MNAISNIKNTNLNTMNILCIIDKTTDLCSMQVVSDKIEHPSRLYSIEILSRKIH